MEIYIKGLLKVLRKGGLFYLAVFSDRSEKGGFSPKRAKRLWNKRKDFDTGYWTYDHYFNDKLVDKIFGKHFKLISKEKDKKKSPNGSLLLRYVFKKK